MEKEISEILKLINKRKSINKKKYKSKYLVYNDYMDKSIYLLMSLYLLLDEFTKNIEIESEDKEYKIVKKLTPFSYILINIINSCIVVQSTLHFGYSTQVKILLRNYIEISDAYLCFLSDEKFSNFLSTPIKIDQGENYIHVKYERVLKTLKSVMQNLNMPKTLCNEIINTKDKIYKELSESMHSKYVRNIIDAFNVVENDNLKINILGNIGNELEIISRNFLVQTYLFLDILIHVLIKKYELPFFKFGLNGVKFATEYKLIRDYFYFDIMLHIIKIDEYDS